MNARTHTQIQWESVFHFSYYPSLSYLISSWWFVPWSQLVLILPTSEQDSVGCQYLSLCAFIIVYLATQNILDCKTTKPSDSSSKCETIGNIRKQKCDQDIDNSWQKYREKNFTVWFRKLPNSEDYAVNH